MRETSTLKTPFSCGTAHNTNIERLW